MKTHSSWYKRSSRQAGFTLLLAALISSIVLTLATAIFSIAQKQIVLSSLSQQSQYAFYAADTAAECALYWQEQYKYFDPTTPLDSALPMADDPNAPTCDGTSIRLSSPLSNQSYLPNGYKICPTGTSGCASTIPLVSLGNGSFCADITVIECQGTISNTGICTTGGSTIATQIRADGYNASCSSYSTSPTALERTVVLNF